MSDARGRKLERAFHEEGTQEAREAWEAALVRAGHPGHPELRSRLLGALREQTRRRIKTETTQTYAEMQLYRAIQAQPQPWPMLPYDAYTCSRCPGAGYASEPHSITVCPDAFDDYNTHGDCIAEK